MLFGWASGTFGLFGLTKQDINDPVLNAVGVVLSILGFFIYMQIKTEDTSVDAKRFSDRKAQQEYRKLVVAQSQSLLHHEEEHGPAIEEVRGSIRSSVRADDAPRPSVTFRESDVPRPSVTFRDIMDNQYEDNAERPSVLFRDSEMERPSMNVIPEEEEVDEYNPLAFRSTRLLSDQSNVTGLSSASTKSRSIGDDWSVERKRAVGMTCAVVAGIFFGCSFDPAQYVIDNKYDGNDNSLNYVFSQFLGILLTSWFYTVVYSLYHYVRGSKPYINAESVLPATLSGIVRGIALIAWFTANGELGFPITFPIVTAGPGLVGALWGIFVFKEITGRRNFMVLGTAVTVTMLSMALIAMSR
jgi:hypothetical protein